MRADLDHTLRAPCRFHHSATFENGEGNRFLDIDILARCARVNGLDRVPVIGRGNHHGVDILALKYLAEIGIGVGFAIQALMGFAERRSSHIAQSDNLSILMREKRGD